MRTVGIEEELLVVGAADLRPVPAGDSVVASASTDDADSQFEAEFKREQAELGSAPSTSIAELGVQLRDLRTRMMTSAHEHDAVVVAVATSPFKVRPTLSEGERYAAMTERFGLLARQQLTCGQHVHVSIESRAEGVAVLDRIRPWLHVLTAVSANSPFWQGQDSGYGSYRSIMWGLWPTAGPTEPFGDEAGYDAAIESLVRTGAAMDDGMIYFDARLSASYPTVEIRVADVCTDIGDALLVAALARALVDTAAAHWRADVAVPAVRADVLRAAAWRAARSGVAGDLVNPVMAESLPAGRVLQGLVEYVGESLEANGDMAGVTAGLRRLAEDGTGSVWQRRSFARRSRLRDVVDDAVRRTALDGSVDG